MSETEQVEEVETVACSDCGDQHDPDKMHEPASGSTVCESCLDGYVGCEDCGQYHGENDVYSVNGGNTIVCEDCRDSNYRHCDDCDEWDSECTSYVGGMSQVCQSCLDNNYGYCDDCDEYYHHDNGCGERHDNDCDCESPAQTFSIRNDGDDALKNDTRVSVQLPAGTISAVGVQDISRLITTHARTCEDRGEENKWYDLSYALDKIGDQWQAKDGNYTKRLSRYAYREFGLKVPADMLSEVGNIGRDHSTAVDFAIEVTRNLNLPAAEFSEEGSCWWGSYSESRCAFKSNGGFGLRTFASGTYGHVTGRAWVLPLKLNDSGELVPTFDTETPAAFMVFNGYHALGGYAPARIMSHMAGMTYRKVSFSASPMYVNFGSSGNGGDSVGYLIAPEEIASEYNTDGALHLDLEEHARLYAREQLHKSMEQETVAA